MTIYTCDRCLCSFNRKSSYDNHLKRKIQCKLVVQKDDKNIQTLITEINKMKEQIKEQSIKIKEMENTINKQNKTITKYEKCDFRNSINNIDKSTNINVIAFGKEDLSFITDDNYKKIMNKGYAAPSVLTEYIHYNKDKPENHNLYISNKKDKKHIHVYDGKKWIVRLTKDVIDELKINASELIKAKIEILDPNNKKDAGILKKIKRFVDSYNKDDNLNDFDENYELMFYNNREMVKNTHSL